MTKYILWVRRWDTHASLDVPIMAESAEEAEAKFNRSFRDIFQIKGVWTKEEYDNNAIEEDMMADWLKEIYE